MNSSPIREHACDLLVVGGGLAGVCAAISAARHGARTILVHERPCLGGNASSEIRVVPYGCSHSHRWSGETGLIHDLILRDRVRNHEHFFDHGGINALWDLGLEEAVRAEVNLTLILDASVRAVETQPSPDGRPAISAVLARQQGSGHELRFLPRQVVDATGDGTVGVLAGNAFRYGREARSEFSEALAPLQADACTMGSTITLRARDAGRPAPFTPPAWAHVYRTPADIGPGRGFSHLGKPLWGGWWWLEVCNPFHQIEDCQTIRHELHRHIFGIWDYLKNHAPERDKTANLVLDWIGMVPGRRESRRLVGDVTLTEQDCHRDRRWPDGVCYAGWWIDLHIPGGIANKTEPGERENIDQRYKHWIRVPPFTLPLRALHGRDVANLWMSGRCVSVSRVALGPMRVMVSLGAQGQAVGTAAAYALAHDLTPRQASAPDGGHIQRIRQLLLRDDARLLGVRNEDAGDLARSATASASSAAQLDLGRPAPGRWQGLDRDRGLVLPLTAPRLDRVAVLLRNRSGAAQRIAVRLERLERIWDRDPGQVLAEGSLSLAADAAGWQTVELAAAISPGPHRLVLAACPGVEWAEAEDAQPGCLLQHLFVSPGGCEDKNAALPCYQPAEVELPAYRHWRQSGGQVVCALPGPPSQPFTAAMAINGRAAPEDLPNLWISDPLQPLPQHLQLDFATPQSIAQVQLAFDTDLALTTGDRPAFHRTPTCVRDFAIEVRQDGVWREVHRETGNCLRLRRIDLAPVQAESLRLVVLATNGAPTARVYELRVYGPGDAGSGA